jgi:hypothetical protein
VSSNDAGEWLRYAGYVLYRRTAEAMTCRAALDTVLAAVAMNLARALARDRTIR